MKIQKTSSLRHSGGAKKTTAKGGFGQALRQEVGGLSADQGAAELGGLSAAVGVSALLSAQDLGDDRHGRRREIRRAETILDELEELRMGLLFGSIPHWRLERIGALVKRHIENLDKNLGGEKRDDESDGLRVLLDDIELRAVVELAKLGR